MRNEQARKLLGGYATNSLTEAERNALFEAALDDQELFDALQQEQALKDLLADPASRRQIQHALAQQTVTGRVPWWARGWAWGAVAGAVAATVLIVTVIRTNQPRDLQLARVQPSPEVAAPVSPPRTAVPRQPAPRQAKRTVSSDEDRMALAPARKKDKAHEPTTLPQPAAPAAPPPPPQLAPIPSQQAQQLRTREDIQVQAGAAQVGPAQVQREVAPRAGLVGGFLAGYQGPLRYSLVRRDSSGAYSPLPAGAALSPGDSVRIVVQPGVAGYLSLYQLDAGQWNKLMAQSDRGMVVAASASQTIPDTPIVVKDSEQRFRLTLVPTAGATAKSLAEPQSGRADTPLVIEISIAPGKVP